nr:hypothetical protein Iba_chr01aCG6970 [Ipomoea batatas]
MSFATFIMRSGKTSYSVFHHHSPSSSGLGRVVQAEVAGIGGLCAVIVGLVAKIDARESCHHLFHHSPLLICIPRGLTALTTTRLTLSNAITLTPKPFRPVDRDAETPSQSESECPTLRQSPFPLRVEEEMGGDEQVVFDKSSGNSEDEYEG